MRSVMRQIENTRETLVFILFASSIWLALQTHVQGKYMEVETI